MSSGIPRCLDAERDGVVPAGHAWTIVIALGIGHMLVDTASIFAIQRAAGNTYAGPGVPWMLTAYNLLAFATQFALGLGVDWLRAARLSAIAGAAMVAGACVLQPALPIPAMAIAGLGNALFHVGAGCLVLQLARGNAAMPGVFVAPGDFGVILGSVAGWRVAPLGLALAGVCLAIAACAACLPAVPGRAHDAPGVRSRRISAVIGIAALLCFSVAARGLSAGALTAPWRGDLLIWAVLALVAVSAKAGGGLLADALGWMTIGAGSALAAALWIGVFGFADARATVIGAALAQMAMPITLAALWRIMPHRPALAFGLASTSLSLVEVVRLCGPAFGPPPGATWAVQLIGAATLAAALVWLRRR